MMDQRVGSLCPTWEIHTEIQAPVSCLAQVLKLKAFITVNEGEKSLLFYCLSDFNEQSYNSSYHIIITGLFASKSNFKYINQM